MTVQEIREAAKVMEAYTNGKKIQYLNDDNGWIDAPNPLFDWDNCVYRIKPEDTYRPFKTQEECWNEMLKHQPFGWVRSKKYNALLWNVTSINKDDITIICDYYKFHRAFECFEFTDGTPFGIKEE